MSATFFDKFCLKKLKEKTQDANFSYQLRIRNQLLKYGFRILKLAQKLGGFWIRIANPSNFVNLNQMHFFFLSDQSASALKLRMFVCIIFGKIMKNYRLLFLWRFPWLLSINFFLLLFLFNFYIIWALLPVFVVNLVLLFLNASYSHKPSLIHIKVNKDYSFQKCKCFYIFNRH